MIATTHRKLEKAADETSTQVAIYIINKWRAKINEKEVYNIRNPLGMGDKKKKEIKGRRLMFLPPWKAFVTKH